MFNIYRLSLESNGFKQTVRLTFCTEVHDLTDIYDLFHVKEIYYDNGKLKSILIGDFLIASIYFVYGAYLYSLKVDEDVYISVLKQVPIIFSDYQNHSFIVLDSWFAEQIDTKRSFMCIKCGDGTIRNYADIVVD